MRKIMMGLAVIVVILTQASPALAACTSNTIFGPDGRATICTTCCNFGYCTTTCF